MLFGIANKVVVDDRGHHVHEHNLQVLVSETLSISLNLELPFADVVHQIVRPGASLEIVKATHSLEHDFVGASFVLDEESPPEPEAIVFLAAGQCNPMAMKIVVEVAAYDCPEVSRHPIDVARVSVDCSEDA